MAIDLPCINGPTDRQTRRAAKRFGEGLTWTCVYCFEQKVLTQGKGDYWFWQKVKKDG